MNSKNIMITAELFVRLVKYFLLDEENEYQTIQTLLQDKLERLNRHELYTEYKKADDPQKQETARQSYLDSKGVPESFRW